MGSYKLDLQTDKASVIQEKSKEKLDSNVAYARTEETVTLNIKKSEDGAPKAYKRVVILKCGMIKTTDAYEKAEMVEGDELVLKRKSDSTDYKWGIAVYTKSGEMLGYLPYDKNQSTARLMDAGKTITAEVGNVNDKDYTYEAYIRNGREKVDIPVTVYMEIEVEGDGQDEN